MIKRKLLSALAFLCVAHLCGPTGKVVAQTTATGGDPPPTLVGLTYPQGGDTQIIFRGKTGPFRVQTRSSLAATTPWNDILTAKVTEVQPGVFLALVPRDQQDVGYYRIVSEGDVLTELKGWMVRVQVSTPANGLYYVRGERPVVSVTILDTMAQGISRTDLSTLALYMHGPEDPMKTVTPVKLLNATADRTKTPHHFIDLKTNPDAKLSGTVVSYTLQPVADEAPGTYTVSIRAILASDGIQQIMKFVKVQIGTDKVEAPVIADSKCAACHLGPSSKKMYMHHVDPGRSPVGSFAMDMEPQNSCKACHNNEGYAAFTDASAPGGRRPDHIVIRAHGVHMGEHLSSDFNTNHVTGNFRDYTEMLFPADVRNCTACHVNDRWKTQPSRLACGTCHDNSWFGPKASTPTGMVAHAGGPATDDLGCATCHVESKIFKTVEQNHLILEPKMNEISLSLTPPVNRTNYVAGEKPQVTLVFKDDSGKPIDHTQLSEANFSAARLFVYGPRARAVPVLTTIVKDGNSKLSVSVTSRQAGPWAINGKTFKIAVNGSAPQEIKIVGATNLVTAAEVVASLNTVITNLNGGATASVSGANVNIRTKVLGNAARIEIYNGDVTTAMAWKAPGVVLEPDVTVAAGSTQSNDIRARTNAADNDPMVTRTATNITYQLGDVAGLPPGTYSAYSYSVPTAGKVAGLTGTSALGHLTFQIGTATIEKKVASNCADCHGTTIFHFAGNIHPAAFNNDQCLACHDYGRVATGEMFKNQGGTSLSGWSGYGAMPEVRRIHGVHRGAYLQYPEEIYANATKDTFGHIIFSQDIRNCTKCHSESDTWKQKPSRMACLACHDSDTAKIHGKLMTFTPDPSDPYGPKAVETCVLCHGAGTEFSPDKVHSLSNPYRPPYPRAAE